MMNEGTLSITNSDIVGNTGDGPSGGVWNLEGTTDVVNSIISGNTQDDASTHDNCQGAFTTTSHNIEDGTTCGFTGSGDLDANPDLGALAYNGGPLETEALLAGSPAIQAALTRRHPDPHPDPHPHSDPDPHPQRCSGPGNGCGRGGNRVRLALGPAAPHRRPWVRRRCAAVARKGSGLS